MLYRWDCTTWRIKPENAKSMLDTASSDYAAVARVYFVQYHLHLQLLSASRCAIVCYICVLPHTTIYVSSYYYICVLILLHICVLMLRFCWVPPPSWATQRLAVCGVRKRGRVPWKDISIGCYICVLILLHMCPHATLCVLMLLYMCLYTTIQVCGKQGRVP
jgi:hypothetical protein